MADSFVDLLARLSMLEAQLRDMVNRVPAIQYAQVTAINPERRMIRVSREAQGGQVQTDWFAAGRRSPYEDEPLPPVGTTVLIGAVNGDPHDLVLLRTIANATNPPDPAQAKPENDNTVEIPGDERKVIVGKQFDKVGGDRTMETHGELLITGERDILIDSDQNVEITALQPKGGEVLIRGFNRVRLEDHYGAYIQMAGGLLEIRDRFGRKWTLGGSNWVFDLAGATFHIINAGDFTVSQGATPGPTVATIGAPDDEGDNLIGAGWK